MATLLSFHAHPDDESITTAGTLAKAVEAGHRVILVWATRGEHGEVDEGFLDPGEELWRAAGGGEPRARPRSWASTDSSSSATRTRG